MQRPPIRYIVQIGDCYLSGLIYYRLYYDKPCSLLYQSPQTGGVTAVELVVDSGRATELLFRIKEKTGCRLCKVE